MTRTATTEVRVFVDTNQPLQQPKQPLQQETQRQKQPLQHRNQPLQQQTQRQK